MPDLNSVSQAQRSLRTSWPRTVSVTWPPLMAIGLGLSRWGTGPLGLVVSGLGLTSFVACTLLVRSGRIQVQANGKTAWRRRNPDRPD